MQAGTSTRLGLCSLVVFQSLRGSLLALIVALIVFPASATAQNWEPIDPIQLSMTSPVVEPDADAEAIFWKVDVAHVNVPQGFSLRRSHYLRLKVFTDRGVESQSQVEIPYSEDVSITGIRGRTVQPDGTVVELGQDAIFARTIVETDDREIQSKLFAMPGVQPGSIVEYQWTEYELSLFVGAYTRFDLYRDVPVRHLEYSVQPLRSLAWRITAVNAPPLTKNRDGYPAMVLDNVPASREEEFMPPKGILGPWLLLRYSDTPDRGLDGDAYWRELGKDLHGSFMELNVNNRVRAATKEAIGDTSTPEEQLQELFTWVRSEVRNVEDDVESFTPAEREEPEEDDDSPSDVLERGYGTPLQINMLFGAMASAAGFEARWAFLSDRSEFLFNPELSEAYFLRYGVIAVREEEEWRFFDPASRYVPYGMLQWRHEGVTALVTDRREPVFVFTPTALPGNSIERRSAEMRLDMDGSLEGHVRIVRTGHIGAAMKESYDALSAAEREERLINTLRNRLPTAEVRSVEIENAADPELPLVVSYDVRIPGYGQRTGQRLFFMPAFFPARTGPATRNQ